MANNKTLRIPRSILAEMTNNNSQAIKALEGMQLSIFDLLPADIADIIQRAAADAMQASMIANQVREQLQPYLQAVAVPLVQSHSLSAVNIPIEQSIFLQAVSSSTDCNYQLQAV